MSVWGCGERKGGNNFVEKKPSVPVYVTSDLLHLRSVCRDSRHVFGSLGILGGIRGGRGGG